MVYTVPKFPEKEIKTIDDLIKTKLDNKDDFKDGEEEYYDIDGKTYTFIKNKNDLIVIDDKGNQKTIENYKDKTKKKRFPYKKQHKLVVDKGDTPESGNEPYDESEGEEEPELGYDKIKKDKRKKGKGKGDAHESLTEGEEEPEAEDQDKLIKKKKRPTSEIIKETGKRKPKRKEGESIHESEELSEGKTESLEEGKIPKKKYPKGEEPKSKKGTKSKKDTGIYAVKYYTTLAKDQSLKIRNVIKLSSSDGKKDNTFYVVLNNTFGIPYKDNTKIITPLQDTINPEIDQAVIGFILKDKFGNEFNSEDIISNLVFENHGIEIQSTIQYKVENKSFSAVLYPNYPPKDLEIQLYYKDEQNKIELFPEVQTSELEFNLDFSKTVVKSTNVNSMKAGVTSSLCFSDISSNNIIFKYLSFILFEKVIFK